MHQPDQNQDFRETQPDASVRFCWLRESWTRAWNGLSNSQDGESVFLELIDRYSEPWRKYHTLQHLAECLDLFNSARSLAMSPYEVELALWFHDAVYDVKQTNNEEQSAQLARTVMNNAGCTSAAVGLVGTLILVTKHSTLPSTVDERLIVDIDLGILGASSTRFAEYERQIREEYSFVPIEYFRQKRAEILQSFLDRQPLFSTELIQSRFEANARKNLVASLCDLNSAPAS